MSVIVPMRNEERRIGRCLRSLAAQDYPRDRFEVLVVDGDSTDGSCQVAEQVARETGLPLRLLSNPRRSTPCGLNEGLAQAKGEVIARVDAHAEVSPRFLSESVSALLDSGADVVGGPIRSAGDGLVGGAIALAMSSPFGVGNAAFRYSREEQYTDTVPFPTYRRSVFERIGPLAEDLEWGEDDEFHYRLGDAGGRILLTPRIASTYYVRSSLWALARQYFRYGRVKVEVLRRHPRRARVRQLVPGAFMLGLAATGALASLRGRFVLPLVALAGAYGLASLAASLRAAGRTNRRYLPVLPLAFACLHVSYGLGFLVGLARAAVSAEKPCVRRREAKT
jgi:cellulose synthase/poly-beta-1,6-N-acetylglucosamine synthase-like glycosyltransferase